MILNSTANLLKSVFHIIVEKIQLFHKSRLYVSKEHMLSVWETVCPEVSLHKLLLYYLIS